MIAASTGIVWPFTELQFMQSWEIVSCSLPRNRASCIGLDQKNVPFVKL